MNNPTQKPENKTLPQSWREVRLGDVVDLNPKEKLEKNTLAKKIPMEFLEEFRKKIVSHNQDIYKGGSKFKNGDTLLARITPCLENGKTAYVDILEENEIGFGSTEYIVLREIENLTFDQFIYYFSISPFFREVAIQSMVGSSGRQRVQVNVLQNYHFNLPPLREQKAIAHILGSLDDKIELNRQINKTLEDMAQALFKSWFVNFDPVIDNALKAGNPIPEPFQKRAENRQNHQQKKPLPAEIQNLFPSEFEHHEKMGWIPKGWEVKAIKDMGQVICGKTPSKSKKEYYDGKIPFVKIPNMHSEVYVMQTDEYLTDLGANSQKNKTIPSGSIAVSCIATVGKVVLIHQNSHTNQQINSIIPSKNYYQYYLYFYMLNLNTYFHNLASTGSATLNMNTSTFSNIEILKPNENLLIKYDTIVNGYFKKILNNQIQNQTLNQLRDTLLPKLISGKIRVDDVEKHKTHHI